MPLILEICNLLGSLSHVNVEFCSRDYNSYADCLAKKGAGEEEDVLVWSLT